MDARESRRANEATPEATFSHSHSQRLRHHQQRRSPARTNVRVNRWIMNAVNGTSPGADNITLSAPETSHTVTINGS